MKTIVYDQIGLPIENPRALYETELPKPAPGPHDLLVKIRAIAVNPVDTKVRAGLFGETPQLLGWDAAGIVEAVGAAVTLFKVGDNVFYAGSVTRSSTHHAR
jgi:NADPH:quinone reductase-like Zn-dependent oxidoreductase